LELLHTFYYQADIGPVSISRVSRKGVKEYGHIALQGEM